MEYEENMVDFFDFLTGGHTSSRRLTMKEIHKIVEQLVNGLIEIHKCSVAHRDLKEENIIIDPNSLKIKYIDWGLSVFEFARSAFAGTKEYMAPELFEYDLNSDDEFIPLSVDEYCLVDIWSLGCIIFSLIHHGNSSNIYLKKLASKMGDSNADCEWDWDTPNSLFDAVFKQYHPREPDAVYKHLTSLIDFSEILKSGGDEKNKEEEAKYLECLIQTMALMLQYNPTDRQLNFFWPPATPPK